MTNIDFLLTCLHTFLTIILRRIGRITSGDHLVNSHNLCEGVRIDIQRRTVILIKVILISTLAKNDNFPNFHNQITIYNIKMLIIS